MQVGRELEAKFLIAACKRPKRVLRRVIQELSWAGYLIRPKGAMQVQDRYLDTKNWSLHRAGWTYRLRDADGSITLTLKQLGGGRGALFERREIEQAAHAKEANHPHPGPVAVQLDELLGSHRGKFNELFVLDNHRTRYLLLLELVAQSTVQHASTTFIWWTICIRCIVFDHTNYQYLYLSWYNVEA